MWMFLGESETGKDLAKSVENYKLGRAGWIRQAYLRSKGRTTRPRKIQKRNRALTGNS